MVAELPADGLSVSATQTAATHCRAITREETMKQLRSSRRLIKMWHRREKATVDHVVGATGNAKNLTGTGTTHSAFTSSGLAVQDQVRKAWRPYPAGLAIF
jgi:hypothetical protein